MTPHLKGWPSRRNQPTVLSIPAPQPIIGQFGPAPPTMNGVMLAEIVAPGQNGSTEFGER